MTARKPALRQKAVNAVHTIQSKLQSSPVLIGLIVTTFIVYIAVIVFNILSTDPSFSHGLFIHGTSNISNEHPLNITPPGFAFLIWNVIYILQLIWNIYNLALLCRRTDQGPAYLNPVILSPVFLIFFNLSSGFNIGWLFLWDRLLFLPAFIFLTCITLSLWLTFAIVSSRLVMFKDTLVNQGRSWEFIFLQIAAVNGVAMYATWTVAASLINLGVVMVYTGAQPVANETASIICISILAFVAVLYIVLDVTVLERFTQYAVTPYAVVIWVLAAITSKHYNANNVSAIMTVVLLGAVSLAFVIKLGITFYKATGLKHFYRQMKYNPQVITSA